MARTASTSAPPNSQAELSPISRPASASARKWRLPASSSSTLATSRMSSGRQAALGVFMVFMNIPVV